MSRHNRPTLSGWPSPLAPVEHRLSHSFHVARSSVRGSIIAHGLDYSRGEPYWDEDYPEGLYLFRKIGEAVEYAEGLGEPCDVWELMVAVELESDPLHPECAYTTAKLPPETFRPVLHIAGLRPTLDAPPFPTPTLDELSNGYGL